MRVWYKDKQAELRLVDKGVAGFEGIPDNSIDSIVTDPPYHLYSIVKRFGGKDAAPAKFGTDGVFQRASKGFMGKEWDGGDVSYDPATWAECLRVLKPGGHMLCFGGSRTFHRIAVAIEDAGFELRDTVMWVYGCLSEDTEILTLDGWVRFDSPLTTSPVVCYNSQKNTFEAHQARKKYLYDNKHTAYHIKSDLTDQIVSRNHRVAVERDGRIVFEYAENLQTLENIPVLESLHYLPETIYDFQQGASIKKQDLLKRVQWQANITEENRNGETSGTKGIYADSLPCVREEGVEAKLLAKESCFAYLQSKMQRNIEGRRVEVPCSQREGGMDAELGTEIERKNDGSIQPFVDGRNNILQKAWQLCWGKICQMPSRILANGKERRICNGTSVVCGSSNREAFVEDGGCSSCQPYSVGQQDRESDAIYEQSASQTIREQGLPRTTLATITPIEYKGKVWCIEVPTGAFVARRNGQVFITGNSGFPKSHDVSKAIDKEAGAERAVIGSYTVGGTAAKGKHKGRAAASADEGSAVGCTKDLDITAPATPAAQQWQGWGTALKPAFEPIILARKPMEGTVAGNVLKWGTGAINVDGCRVDYVNDNDKKGALTGFKAGEVQNTNINFMTSPLKKPNCIEEITKGRWPANFIHDGSEEVLELMPETGKSNVRPPTGKPKYTGSDKDSNAMLTSSTLDTTQRGHEDNGGSAARFFMKCEWDGGLDTDSAARFNYCAKASKKDRDEGCEGEAAEGGADLTLF